MASSTPRRWVDASCSCTNWNSAGTGSPTFALHVAGCLAQMTQLQRLILHTLIVDDLDYHPLLRLPNLQKVRVMATRGMEPPVEELAKRLPWEA